jgi:hypothetical protein
MPSSNNTSFAEKMLHARALVRLGLRRGDINAIWESQEEKDIFEQFLCRSINEAGVTFQDLLMIHDDELVMLFDSLGLVTFDRCVVRRYLDLPEDALWACWTAAKVSLFFVASAFRLSRAVIGLPGLLLLTAGVGVGLAGKNLRGKILEEAINVVNRQGQRFGTASPLVPNEVLTATQPAAFNQAQATPRGPSATNHSRTVERMRANPFFDPDDMPQKTPRYPIPKFNQYDFRGSSGSPSRATDHGSEEFVNVGHHE